MRIQYNSIIRKFVSCLPCHFHGPPAKYGMVVKTGNQHYTPKLDRSIYITTIPVTENTYTNKKREREAENEMWRVRDGYLKQNEKERKEILREIKGERIRCRRERERQREDTLSRA